MMKIWDCKLVIEADELPYSFDFPPRRAVIETVEKHGFKVLACFSGWGGELNQIENEIVMKREREADHE